MRQENYHRPDEDEMADRILQLLDAADYKANVFVDSANQAFIRKLKTRVRHNEVVDLEWHLDYLRSNKAPDSEFVNHMILFLSHLMLMGLDYFKHCTLTYSAI